MPEKKKPASRTPARPARSSRPARAAKAPAKTTRRPAAPRRRTRAEEPPETDELTLVSDADTTPGSATGPVVLGAGAAAAAGSSAGDELIATDTDRGVAVAGEPGTEGLGVAGQPVAGGPGTEIPPSVSETPDRYPEDIGVIVASAVLMVSPFLPWYRLQIGTGRSVGVSGWETGTWGPMIVFLGLASLLLAVFRRTGLRVGLPISDAHIHEGVGWLSIIGAVIKYRAVPAGLERMWLVWLTVAAGFALAFLAGRMSSSTPFVTIPDWFKGRAGKIGLALLVLTIGGAVAFGMTNSVDVQELAFGRPSSGNEKPGANNPPDVLRGRFPKCSEGFPKPSGAKAREGVEAEGQRPCVFTFGSDQTPQQLRSFYTSELPKAGYTFTELPSGQTTGFAFTFTKPKCGSMSIQRATGQQQTTVIVAVGGICPSFPPASGRASPSPSPSR